MSIDSKKRAFSKYLKMVGFILLFMAIYLVIQVAVSTAVTILYTIKLGLESGVDMDFDKLQNTVLQSTGFIIFLSGLFALPVYLLVSVCRNESFPDTSGFRKVSVRDIGLSALMGIGVSIVLAMALSFVPVEKWFPDYVQTMDQLIGNSNLLVIILGTGIMAPLIEEVIFRGYILKELEKHLPVTAAVIIQGILFGIFHFNILQSIYAALLGILLGFVFIWTRSIWASIVVHLFINNTSTVLSKVLGEEFAGYYVLLALVTGIIASTFSIYTMWKGRKKEQAAIDVALPHNSDNRL